MLFSDSSANPGYFTAFARRKKIIIVLPKVFSFVGLVVGTSSIEGKRKFASPQPLN